MDGTHTTQDGLVRRWLEDSELNGNGDPLLIKRAYPRLPVGHDFYLRPQEQSDTEYFAKGHNISPSGLGVLCKAPIAGDTKVMIRSDMDDVAQPWVEAKVIHCTLSLGGYKIGLEFLI